MGSRIIEWIKTRPKTAIEILIFLSLGLAILFYILAQDNDSVWMENTGKGLLIFFFVSFLLLLFYDFLKYIYRKIRG